MKFKLIILFLSIGFSSIICSIEKLPKDRQLYIISNVIFKSATIEDAIKNIKNISRVSKYFKVLIDEKIEYIINELAQNFNINNYIVARKLGINVALKWLDKNENIVRVLIIPDRSILAVIKTHDNKLLKEQIIRGEPKGFVTSKTIAARLRPSLFEGLAVILEKRDEKWDKIDFHINETKEFIGSYIPSGRNRKLAIYVKDNNLIKDDINLIYDFPGSRK